MPYKFHAEKENGRISEEPSFDNLFDSIEQASNWLHAQEGVEDKDSYRLWPYSDAGERIENPSDQVQEALDDFAADERARGITADILMLGALQALLGGKLLGIADEAANRYFKDSSMKSAFVSEFVNSSQQKVNEGDPYNPRLRKLLLDRQNEIFSSLSDALQVKKFKTISLPGALLRSNAKVESWDCSKPLLFHGNEIAMDWLAGQISMFLSQKKTFVTGLRCSDQPPEGKYYTTALNPKSWGDFAVSRNRAAQLAKAIEETTVTQFLFVEDLTLGYTGVVGSSTRSRAEEALKRLNQAFRSQNIGVVVFIREHLLDSDTVELRKHAIVSSIEVRKTATAGETQVLVNGKLADTFGVEN